MIWASLNSVQRTAKHGRLLQVSQEIVDITEIPAKDGLLVGLAANVPVVAIRAGTIAAVFRVGADLEGLGELTRAALQHGGDRLAGVGDAGDRRRLGHEVEVEELHAPVLDLLVGAARLEKRRHGEQAVEVLVGARVLRVVHERDVEDAHRRALDRGAEVGLEEVQEQLFRTWHASVS